MKKILFIAVMAYLFINGQFFMAKETPNIVYVDDDFNSSMPEWNITCFNKIKDAINAVAENGIVYVYDGLYEEKIIVNKTINMIGINMPIIKNVRIEKNSTIIKNFEIINGSICINASYCKIENCRVYNGSGIKIFSDNNEIKYCIIENNTYGVYIDGKNNLVYLNNFIENDINAYENGTNFWNNETIGNYWDDYNGYDIDGDGIGDIPYEINGNFDNFPLISPIDLFPPITNITIDGILGNNGWYISNVTITLNATDGYINYSINDIWYKSNESICNFSLGNGIYEIKYYAVDKNGNKERIKKIEIKIDTILPNISYFLTPSIPNGNNGWYISNVELHLFAEDENGIDELNYKINKGGWEDYTGFFLLQFEGIHKIYFKAIDMAGNEKIENITIKIDKNPPYIKIEKLKFVKGEYEVKWDAYDEISDLANLTMFYSPDGENWQIIGSVNGTSYLWNTSNYTDSKTAFLKIEAIDNAGNIGNDTSQFVLDNTPPVVKINEPKKGKFYGKDEYGNIIIEIEWEAYDEIDENLDGNITIEYYNGEWNVLVENYSNVGRYTLNAKEWEDGEYIIRIKARDDCGNIGIAESGNFTIDKKPPSIYISRPLKGYLYINLFGREILPPIKIPEIYDVIIIGKIDVEVIATDAHSGIQRVEIKTENTSYIIYEPPYKWEWNPSLGLHKLKAIAYDNAGNSKMEEIEKILCINM